MADKWPLANGNWSNAANWNDGTKPVSGDTVYADGKTLTIDENIDIGSGVCTTETRSSGTAGGSFVLNSNRIITANFRAGTTTCISSWGTGVTLTGNVQGSLVSAGRNGASSIGSNSVINGNILAGTQSDSYGVSSFTNTGVVVNGNVQGGPGGGLSAPGISSFTGSMTVNGNVLGGTHVSNDSSYQNFGISGIGVGANLVVNGNLNSPSSTVAALRITASAGAFTITVNGNVYAGTQSNNQGIRYTVTTATGNVVINGNVYAKGADGINFQGTGSLIVTGDAVGGINGYGVGNYSIGGTVRIYGTAIGNDWGLGYASNGGFAGVYGGGINTGVVETVTSVRSVRHGANGQAGVAGRVFLDITDIANSSVKMRGNPSSFTEYTLATAENLGSLPSNSDVRLGVVFNFGNRTGTCAVPPAGSVLLGVPVDNTTGTATIDATSISAALADEFATLLAAIGNIEVDNQAIAEAVETQLEDDFQAVLNAVENIEVDNAAIASAVRIELTDELEIINNIPDSFDAISTQIDEVSTVVYVSPAAFTSPGKITGRSLRPYYKDTSRLGPIGIADSTKTPIDLSDFDGDLYVSVMDADTLEVLLYDDDPYFVTSSLYIDPSPESVGVLNAPLCWALRRISNNQTLMEGPWEVQFAAYRTTS